MDGTPSPERPGVTGDVDRVVRCAGCAQVLTSAAAALSPEGGHLQTFVNPDGVVFSVRLFVRVDGARCEGVPQGKTSWFPGTAWVYAFCVGCRRQVGWRYSGGADFFGLMADRIVDD